MENSYLYNGRFLHNLDGWTSSGASYSAGDGDEHYGVAVLPVGASIEQSFGVEGVRIQTVHVSIKSPGGTLSSGQCVLTIEDGDGNTLLTQSLTGGASWTENTLTCGLASGMTYTIRIENVSAPGDVRVDDVWIWALAITRAEIAARVHDGLGRLATERGYSTTPSGNLTEGSYTYAIDSALRTIGAIDDETGLPDVRLLDAASAQAAISHTRREMLEKLQREYAAEVDTSVGQYSQSLSQKAAAIAEMLNGNAQSGASSLQPIAMRKITYG